MSSAIAASTRFHGSVWWPGNHGRFPSGSCTAAIAAQVSATSARLKIPGTSGSSRCDIGWLLSRRCPLLERTLGVDDEALPQDGIERLAQRRQPTGTVRQLPYEEVVVALNRPGGVGALDARRAPQPPVRRMQRVGMVRVERRQSRGGELGLEL